MTDYVETHATLGAGWASQGARDALDPFGSIGHRLSARPDAAHQACAKSARFLGVNVTNPERDWHPAGVHRAGTVEPPDVRHGGA